MAEVTLRIGSPSSEIPYIARYTGEKFPLIFVFEDEEEDTALDVTDATLSMELGTITKADGDFTKNYGGEVNKTSVTLETTDTADAGEYKGQVTIDLTTTIRKSNPIILVLMSGTEALTIEEIRMALWDLAADNELLQDIEFPDTMLVQARQMAIDLWNSSAGDFGFIQYTVNSFPSKWKSKWRTGAVAEALMMKARNLTGNTLALSAAGVTVDDKGPRAKTYFTLAQALRAEWVTWIREQQYYETWTRGFYELSNL